MMQWWRQVYYSFPVQLIVLHLRSNHLLLAIWIGFVLLMSGIVARKFGFQYLMLDPEYLGAVSFWSFFIQGIAFGAFFMSWNLTLYLLSAHYFPFLATLAKPFTKFVINNMLLPLVFFVTYLGFIVHFQHYYEGVEFGRILLYCLAFTLGGVSLILLYSTYFHFANRDISYYKPELEDALQQHAVRPQKQFKPGRRKVDLEYIKLDANRWDVHNYLSESLRSRLVRSVAHYDSKMLLSIFQQNHLNALILQLVSMLLLLILGYQVDAPVFRIPAGASLFLLASLFVAVIGAVTYWFNEWSITIMILLLAGINFITRLEPFDHTNKAYGMDYEVPPSEYSLDHLQSIYKSGQIQKDTAATLHILNNWKKKTRQEKPKMVVLCVSGGGMKAATWSMQVVQQADSLLNGELLKHTVLITGASGGMLGMGYLRELYWAKQQGKSVDLYNRKHIDQLTQDMVNSIAFTFISNDLFLPWATFEKNGKVYRKDRGYILEQQLNENTDSIMDKPLIAYKKAEQDATIPMLFLTPAIINDARRLVISPQGVSYMMMAPVGQRLPNAIEIDAVDFRWMFAAQNADSLGMLSALRMNATYPYVLPNVHLPSDPVLEVVDAGFLDNYGILAATRFIQVFQDWIKENTSGVILLQLSSSQKIEEIGTTGGEGVIESLFNPIGIVGKVLVTQEFEQDNSLGFIDDILGAEKFELIRFIYRPTEEAKLEASISFHITEKEKEDILRAIELPANRTGLRQLEHLIAH
ncbi:MAG: hypothetical protein MI974_03290 [Chitinophagales bacterium]|nr:hypothetical protein [Chitinophagales bacterium]